RAAARRAVPPARRRRGRDRAAAGTGRLLAPARPRRRLAALDGRARRGGGVLDDGVAGRRRSGARLPAYARAGPALPPRRASRRVRLVLAERSRTALRARCGRTRRRVAAPADSASDLAGSRGRAART